MQGGAAEAACVREEYGFLDAEVRFRQLDERVVTRLGLEDRRVLLGGTFTSPFGARLSELSIPGWMAGDCLAEGPDGPVGETTGELYFTYCTREYTYSRFGLERGPAE